MVPAVRGATATGGANSEVVDSQCCPVDAVASVPLPGQEGTNSGAVLVVSGGMKAEAPATKRAGAPVTWMR